MKSSKSNYIVETAGLPGSGKTTILGILAGRVGRKCLLRTKFSRRCIRKFHLDRLFYPATLCRFHKLFRILYKAETDNAGFLRWCLSLLRAAGSTNSKGDGSVGVAADIFAYLNDLTVEYFVVRWAGLLSGRPVVLDEGYVQRSIGVWLRAPEALKEALSIAFLSSVPASVHCMVFDCEPERALRRCRARERGATAVEKWLAPGDVETDALSGSYNRMAKLISEHIISDLDCTPLRVEAEPDATCSNLIEELERIRPVNRWLIHLRN